MKSVFLSICLCLLLFGISNPLKGQAVAAKSYPGIEKEIDALFLESVKAAETLDVARLVKSVDDNHKAGFIVNGNFYNEFAELANILKGRSPGSVKQTITIQKKKITVLAENIALVTASGLSRVEVNGGTPIDLNFFWTFVYEKINNEWKVIQSHQSAK